MSCNSIIAEGIAGIIATAIVAFTAKQCLDSIYNKYCTEKQSNTRRILNRKRWSKARNVTNVSLQLTSKDHELRLEFADADTKTISQIVHPVLMTVIAPESIAFDQSDTRGTDEVDAPTTPH